MPPQLGPKRVLAEIEATQDDYFRQRRDEFVPWVRLLQTASTPEAFMRLQIELRDRFAGRQHGMQHVGALLDADRAERKRLAPTKPRPQATLDELRRRIEIRERLSPESA